jgi:hypothetical protein
MGVFVLSSRGDLYTTPHRLRQVGNRRTQTFDTPVFAANRRIKNTENTVIGSNKFYNDTSQLKNIKTRTLKQRNILYLNVSHSNTPAGRTCFPRIEAQPALREPRQVVVTQFPRPFRRIGHPRRIPRFMESVFFTNISA